MANDWIMVRLQRATHAELLRVRDSLELAEAVGLRELERDHRQQIVSLDQVVRVLIAFRDKHAERRKRSAAQRKAKRVPPS
jgi:hypothetical protein